MRLSALGYSPEVLLMEDVGGLATSSWDGEADVPEEEAAVPGPEGADGGEVCRAFADLLQEDCVILDSHLADDFM